MVKIRMSRYGRHKSPFYRIVAVDAHQKVKGGYIELLGTFDPSQNDAKLNKESILKWMQNGAQLSPTVKSFLTKQKLYAEFIKTIKTNKTVATAK